MRKKIFYIIVAIASVICEVYFLVVCFGNVEDLTMWPYVAMIVGMIGLTYLAAKFDPIWVKFVEKICEEKKEKDEPEELID